VPGTQICVPGIVILIFFRYFIDFPLFALAKNTFVLYSNPKGRGGVFSASGFRTGEMHHLWLGNPPFRSAIFCFEFSSEKEVERD